MKIWPGTGLAGADGNERVDGKMQERGSSVPVGMMKHGWFEAEGRDLRVIRHGCLGQKR